MGSYDDATLEHLHDCEMEILNDFITVCNELGVQYFALAGTVLGAVRHQDFIPWDDDIDVALPAKDLARVLEVFERDWSDKYLVMDTERYIDYPLASVRLMLKGTEFRETPLKDIPVDLGIFLDLYGLDNVADDEAAYKKQAWDAWFWSHVRILLSIPNPVIIQHGLGGVVRKAASKVVGALFRASGMSKEKAFAKEQEARRRYENVETKRFAYLCDTDRFSTTFEKDKMLPPVNLPFRGGEIAVPATYLEHLEAMYGPTYMELPPVEHRKNHYPEKLDFGPY